MNVNTVRILFFFYVMSVGALHENRAGNRTITDANWMTMGQSQGIQPYGDDWEICTLELDSSGNLYAGGDPFGIPFAGGIKVDGIAKWDGWKWNPINCDSSHKIYSIAFCFDKIGNLYAPVQDLEHGEYDLARWNGSEWTFLNTGFYLRSKSSYPVKSLKLDDNGNFLFAGEFDSAGGCAVKNIVKWNGTVWSGFGEGIRGGICGLEINKEGAIFVGGGFDTAGTIAARNIAKWDGNAWRALGKGTNGYVDVIAIDKNGVVYAGGTFDSAGEVAAHNIAKWDGSTWSAVGSGLHGKERSGVFDLAFDENGSLYASGSFDSAGGIAAYNIAKWDGNSWQSLGNSAGYTTIFDTSHYTSAFNTIVCGKKNKIYAAGMFNIIDGVPSDNIAQWDGTTWSAIGAENGNGLNNYVFTCVSDKNGYIIAGGQFLSSGIKPLKHIGKWNGNDWTPLGKGIDAYWFGLCDMVIGTNNTIYAGGKFDTAGGLPAHNIAKWDGNSWSPLGSGVNGCIYTLALGDNEILYAGGAFGTAGGVPAHGIAKWDGTAWSALGNTGNRFNQISAMTIDENGFLYADNYVDTIDGRTVSHIARWDGNSWTALGRYSRGIVKAFAFDSTGNLYVGACFLDSISGILVNNIAMWDGQKWSALGKGLQNGSLNMSSFSSVYVNALVFDKNDFLYAGGNFELAGDVTAHNIARWDGREWSALGSGFDNTVEDLAFDSSGNLYAGGRFVTAGGKTSPHFAVCRLSETKTLHPDKESPVRFSLMQADHGSVFLNLKAAAKIDLRLYSLSGKEYWYASQILTSGRHKLKIGYPGLAQGIYIAQIKTGNESAHLKMIIEKSAK